MRDIRAKGAFEMLNDTFTRSVDHDDDRDERCHLHRQFNEDIALGIYQINTMRIIVLHHL